MYRFLARTLDTKHDRGVIKRQKPDAYKQRLDSDDMQAFFAAPSNNVSSRFLKPPAAPMRKLSQRVLGAKDDIDDFLSSDLELSFASTMSINSPPRDTIALAPEAEKEDVVPMDISPAPMRMFPSSRKSGGDDSTRPRALTSGRLFGRDVSNDLPQAPPTKTSTTTGKRTQRAALPMEWLGQSKASQPIDIQHSDNNMFAPVSIVSWANWHVVDDVFSSPVTASSWFPRCDGH